MELKFTRGDVLGCLQSEFLKALELMEEQQPKSDSATVTRLERR